MDMTDAEWQTVVQSMNTLLKVIEAWPDTDPDLTALRCEFSRHRTLAHLRAAQETWLQAVLLFAAKEDPSIKLPHPWRLFESQNYASVPWEEHHSAFLADRSAWQELLQRPNLDRNRGGKLSEKPHTIASLTRQLVGHEDLSKPLEEL